MTHLPMFLDFSSKENHNHYYYRNCVFSTPLKLNPPKPVWKPFSDLRFSLGFLDLQGKISHHFMPSKDPLKPKPPKPVWKLWNEFEGGG